MNNGSSFSDQRESAQLTASRYVNNDLDFHRNCSVEESLCASLRQNLIDGSIEGELICIETSTVDNVLATTDEVILDRVHQALHESSYRQLRHLHFYCHSGRVTMQGVVPTFELKHFAHAAVRSVIGVRDIDNDLKVVSSW